MLDRGGEQTGRESREAGLGIFELVFLIVLFVISAGVVHFAAAWMFDEPISRLAWVAGTVALPVFMFVLLGIASAIRESRVVEGGVVPRNAWFLLVVLAHGFRRLAPPYA